MKKDKKMVTYTHPASPENGIKVGVKYELDFVKNIFALDKIKVLFSPVNFNWKELEPKQSKTKDSKSKKEGTKKKNK